MEVSRKNVFMQISTFGFFGDFKYPTDICSLTRRVIFSLVLHSVVGIILLAVAGCLLYGFIGWGYICSGHKVKDFMGAMSVIDLIAVSGLLLGWLISLAAGYIKIKLDEKEERDRIENIKKPKPPPKPKEPSLVPLMYKAWKNKFCIKIELKP